VLGLESDALAPEALGAFLNSAYRCLKNDRDGNAIGTRVDAAEAVPSYLAYVFALHRRVLGGDAPDIYAWPKHHSSTCLRPSSVTACAALPKHYVVVRSQ
jgi:hypothetical protein